jgi:hypothetical protein
MQTHMSSQTRNGRIAVLEFKDDKFEQRIAFSSSDTEHSSEFLAEYGSRSSGTKPVRPLIILEDLGLEWVALLSMQLHVPLGVLARH